MPNNRAQHLFFTSLTKGTKSTLPVSSQEDDPYESEIPDPDLYDHHSRSGSVQQRRGQDYARSRNPHLEPDGHQQRRYHGCDGDHRLHVECSQREERELHRNEERSLRRHFRDGHESTSPRRKINVQGREILHGNNAGP
jgi:hypothetical protein